MKPVDRPFGNEALIGAGLEKSSVHYTIQLHVTLW